MALCERCKRDCCSCQGCREMTTSTGVKCCSNCYSSAERDSQAVAKHNTNVSLQEQLINSIKDILKQRGL